MLPTSGKCVPISPPEHPLEREAEAASDFAERDSGRSVTTGPPNPPHPAGASSGGQALPPELLESNEALLHHNFSRVRVYDDSDAHRAAGFLGARAFTIGSEIRFASGQFAPRSTDGARLIAHELAHVAQAEQGRARSPSGGPIMQRAPAEGVAEDQLEQLRAAIDALGPPPPELPPAYKTVRLEHQAALAQLVAALIELREKGDADPAVREDVRHAAELASDSRAWNFSGFPMALAEGLSEALIVLGMPGEGVTLWEAAFGGLNPPHAQSQNKEQAAFLTRLLGVLPVPSGDPDVALGNLLLIHALYLATARQLDDPTERMLKLDPRGPIPSSLKALLPPMLEYVQGILAAVVDGRVSDPLQVLTTVRDLMEEVANESWSIEGELIEVTISDFSGAPPVHRDIFEPESTSRQVAFSFYTEESKGTAHELKRTVGAILSVVGEQIDMLGVIEQKRAGRRRSQPEKPAGEEAHPFRDDDSLRAWALELFEEAGGVSRGSEALDSVIKELQAYFEAFTVHSDYNIEDINPRFINQKFPRALTGEVIQDCGIYAMRVAYILSLIGTELGLHFYWVKLPIHVALVITGPAGLSGDENAGGAAEYILYAVQNAAFFKISGSQLAPKAVAGTKEAIGTWAAATFVPQANVPGVETGSPDTSAERAVTDVPFTVAKIPETAAGRTLSMGPRGSVKPDDPYKETLAMSYMSLRWEQVAALESLGLKETDYLGVIETYRILARETPWRFLPAAAAIIDGLVPMLQEVEKEPKRGGRRKDARGRAMIAARQELLAAFDGLAAPDLSQYAEAVNGLRAKLRLVPESIRNGPGWAQAQLLAKNADPPAWYNLHLEFQANLAASPGSKDAVEFLSTLPQTNPFRVLLQNAPD